MAYNFSKIARLIAGLGLIIMLFCVTACKADQISDINTAKDDDPSTLTSPTSQVTINSLPQIENLVIQQNGSEGSMTFDIIDDNESVAITVYGRKSGETLYTDISSLFTGDVGTSVSVETGKSILAEDLSGYEFLEIRASDIVAFKQAVVNIVSEDRIKHDVQQMSGIRHYAIPQLLNQTRTYIENEFEKHQLETSRHTFNWNNVGATNLIGRCQGKEDPDKTYIICAHFDSIISTPGADDNASGVAGVLEAMRILSPYEFKYSIDFIGFDLEEVGLIGSKRYVQEIALDQSIVGVINFEMIGYPCRSLECKNLTLPDTSIYNIALPAFDDLRTSFDAAGSQYVPELKISSVVADSDPNFRRSDHAPFWSANIPALFITDGANFRNPHYHQHSDTPETLDYNFAKNIVATAVLTLMDLAEINRTTSKRVELK